MQFVQFFGVSSVVAVVFMFFAVVVVFLALFSSSRHCAVFQDFVFFLFLFFEGVEFLFLCFFLFLKKERVFCSIIIKKPHKGISHTVDCSQTGCLQSTLGAIPQYGGARREHESATKQI